MNQKHGHVNSKERDSFVPHTSRDRGVGDGGAHAPPIFLKL